MTLKEGGDFLRRGVGGVEPRGGARALVAKECGDAGGIGTLVDGPRGDAVAHLAGHEVDLAGPGGRPDLVVKLVPVNGAPASQPARGFGDSPADLGSQHFATFGLWANENGLTRVLVKAAGAGESNQLRHVPSGSREDVQGVAPVARELGANPGEVALADGLLPGPLLRSGLGDSQLRRGVLFLAHDVAFADKPGVEALDDGNPVSSGLDPFERRQDFGERHGAKVLAFEVPAPPFQVHSLLPNPRGAVFLGGFAPGQEFVDERGGEVNRSPGGPARPVSHRVGLESLQLLHCRGKAVAFRRNVPAAPVDVALQNVELSPIALDVYVTSGPAAPTHSGLDRTVEPLEGPKQPTMNQVMKGRTLKSQRADSEIRTRDLLITNQLRVTPEAVLSASPQRTPEDSSGLERTGSPTMGPQRVLKSPTPVRP
jgi:hypothetical protein